MSMQAHQAVKLFGEMIEALKNNKKHGLINRERDEAALALTQSVLIADAIGDTLGDVGPLISTAIDNVSERLA